MAERTAIIIDYEYCVGCADCEIACMEAHGSGPDRMGIKVIKLGPWRTRAGGWQYDFVPLPTDWCDLCATVEQEGARPSCSLECKYSVIKFGTVDQMEQLASLKGKQMLFTR